MAPSRKILKESKKILKNLLIKLLDSSVLQKVKVDFPKNIVKKRDSPMIPEPKSLEVFLVVMVTAMVQIMGIMTMISLYGI